MKKRTFVVLTLYLLWTSPTFADIVVFDETTDTVAVNAFPNMSIAATIEAVVRFDTSQVGQGMIYNQWRPNQEDKQFSYNASLDSLGGFLNIGSPSLLSGPVGQDIWRHIAYVYDGAEERMYLDGQLIGSQLSSGNIPDGTSSRQTVIGAIDRSTAPPDTFRSSFIGQMESLRISSVARYSGTTFSPHSGDFSVDADALLIYNFDEMPGSTSITDSVVGATGTFGVGFAGATNPHIIAAVPEPGTMPLLVFGVLALYSRRLRFTRDIKTGLNLSRSPTSDK
ncbi:hypothetical protein Enr13x_37740 [Stieleria neptunia]|uniref:Ice-binding protein C-terminal domain-containing protein n=1 Tax=Stieleria neptunia TaxID=2527979 RepID=A0A518HSX6_9BACT|nr:LamG-like jellyroll fold domain-containing protein [Stieleria neptunia]QDV43914.1 hypothetical protein Enr13x_37740 [Stieleria neptunia]